MVTFSTVHSSEKYCHKKAKCLWECASEKLRGHVSFQKQLGSACIDQQVKKIFSEAWEILVKQSWGDVISDWVGPSDSISEEMLADKGGRKYSLSDVSPVKFLPAHVKCKNPWIFDEWHFYTIEASMARWLKICKLWMKRIIPGLSRRDSCPFYDLTVVFSLTQQCAFVYGWSLYHLSYSIHSTSGIRRVCVWVSTTVCQCPTKWKRRSVTFEINLTASWVQTSPLGWQKVDQKSAS